MTEALIRVVEAAQERRALIRRLEEAGTPVKIVGPPGVIEALSEQDRKVLGGFLVADALDALDRGAA